MQTDTAILYKIQKKISPGIFQVDTFKEKMYRHHEKKTMKELYYLGYCTFKMNTDPDIKKPLPL